MAADHLYQGQYLRIFMYLRTEELLQAASEWRSESLLHKNVSGAKDDKFWSTLLSVFLFQVLLCFFI
jgi:hypothetical protein